MPNLIITLTRLALKFAVFVMVGGAGAQTRIDLIAGWNLMGNSSAVPIDVAATLGDASKINSVWTWNKTASKWAFYAPSMTSTDLATYAEGKGYDVLTIIPSKGGFWVNASTPSSLPLATSSIAKLAESDLQVGWNLVSSADFRTPSQLNQILSSNMNAAGKAVVSTWAWDATSAKWRFYAPSLESQGGTVLADHIDSKGYLPFRLANTLAATDGYWVNVAAITPVIKTRKAGLFYNYALVGYWSDQQASNLDANYVHKVIDTIKDDGYSGVKFEITIGIASDGTLIKSITFDQLLIIIDYAHSIGLGTSIIINWNLDGGNASYLGTSLKYGTADPPNFDLNNYFNSVSEYFSNYAQKFEAHHVDLIHITNLSYDYLTIQHYEQWRKIIGDIRENYNGAIVCNAGSTDIWGSKLIIDSIAIWNLVDGIGFNLNPYISYTPIYDIDTVISGYYFSQMNHQSAISELIGAAEKYHLPILPQVSAMSTSHALDGGFDPNANELLQTAPITYPELQAIVLKSFFQIAANNIFPYVSGITIGGYNIFTPNFNPNIHNYVYYDMSLFPLAAENVVKQYLLNPPGFRLTDITTGGAMNDVIFTKQGNSKIFLGGGHDEVYGGDGGNQIVVAPLASGIELQIAVAGFVNSSTTYTVDISLGSTKIGTISINYDPSLLPTNTTGWSDLMRLKIPLSYNSELSRLNITMRDNIGFASINEISLYYLGNNIIDPSSANHTIVAGYARSSWVIPGDIMSFDLTKFNLNSTKAIANTKGRFTYIEGGSGADTIEFDPPQMKNHFQISKLGDLTVVTDTAGIYPEVRMKNVKSIKFADGTVTVQ